MSVQKLFNIGSQTRDSNLYIFYSKMKVNFVVTQVGV